MFDWPGPSLCCVPSENGTVNCSYFPGAFSGFLTRALEPLVGGQRSCLSLYPVVKPIMKFQM